VNDASRAVGVVASLLDPSKKAALDADNREEQARLTRLFSAKQKKPLLPIETARENRPRIEWRVEDVPSPAFTGRRVVEGVSLADIAKYIDWTFFFHAWELRGKFPQILDHADYGAVARELYENGKTLLEQIIATRALSPRGVYGFFPAASDGDDVVLFTDERRATELLRFPMLRQQAVKGGDEPYWSLADFVAPKETGLPDHVGGFAVSAGHGVDELVRAYEAEHDDYHAIMVKALADRLAEAFAELLHKRVREEWGYGVGEDLGNEDLIAERYRGIRPAYGYPACPDHSEKEKLFTLLGAPEVGITLTETFAMVPAASVSGLYFAHPEARYFMVGRVDRDQIEDYARRKGIDVATAERWLAPNLAY
jgi:5-methyltetrahydrofolate--homocysteine methyltransferase